MLSTDVTSEPDFIRFEGTTDVAFRKTKRIATPDSHEYLDSFSLQSLSENTDGVHLPSYTRPFLPQQRYRKLTKETFQTLQKWEGTILDIDEKNGEFRAELSDKTNTSAFLEEATFDIDEVSLGDLELLRPGAVFYWSIGYHTDKGGTKSKNSIIRFSRLRGFSESAVNEARIKAIDFLERLRGRNT